MRHLNRNAIRLVYMMRIYRNRKQRTQPCQPLSISNFAHLQAYYLYSIRHQKTSKSLYKTVDANLNRRGFESLNNSYLTYYFCQPLDIWPILVSLPKTFRAVQKWRQHPILRARTPPPCLSATRPKWSHILGFKPRPPILGRQLFPTPPPPPHPLANVILDGPLP